MSVHLVTCVKRCYDSNRPRRYWPGDKDNIESESPIAAHFGGWLPGTKVYQKIRGTKLKPIKQILRVVPGEPPAVEPPTVEPPTVEPPTVEPPAVEPPTVEPPTVEPPVTDFVCDLCNKGGWATSGALAAHRYHCQKKVNAQLPGA